MSTTTPLGSITIDLDEVLRRSIDHMDGYTDVSFPIRMALREMHEDLIGKLEDRMMQEYEQQAITDK